MPISTKDLIVLFRSEMSDPELPGSGDDSDSLWLDSEIESWLGEAQDELCERVDLLFDRSSFSIVTVEQQDLYAVDDRITKVRGGSVKTTTVDQSTGAIQNNYRKLEAISVKELERRYDPSEWDYDSDGEGILNYDWEGLVGTPKYMITDYAVGFLRLVPIPPVVVGATLFTGSHTDVTPSTTILTDTNQSWTPNDLIGDRVTNLSDGSYGIITANTATTVTTAALSNSGQWSQGDNYVIAEEVVSSEQIDLHVYKKPNDPVVMEIPDKHRRLLLHKAKAMAYRKDDIDTQDLNRAAVYENKWEQAVNEIDRQFKRQNRGPQVVAYGGI